MTTFEPLALIRSMILHYRYSSHSVIFFFFCTADAGPQPEMFYHVSDILYYVQHNAPLPPSTFLKQHSINIYNIMTQMFDRITI